ncbi:MAG: hypothetical protein CVU64_15015 [Deltaproteobacteria bacterium HGW-Deltaproteobacteria-21]|nr:MAG: hypothetical protein CVU64_15015 [Deltaproteobacteria bacterium HGW-Deltaproteobacteria-21]
MKRLSSLVLLSFLVIMLGCVTTSSKDRLRVQSLGVEEGVEKYYGDNVEIVTFAPGSGWVKMKTREGISPIISLSGVTGDDIEKFNRFSHSLGFPIRVKLTGDVLSVALEQEEVDYLVTKNNESESALRMASERILWQEDQHPRLAIYRDKDGRVSLLHEVSPAYLAKK